MLLRSGRKHIEPAEITPFLSPSAQPSKLLPWLKLPFVYLTSLGIHPPLFSQKMVDKEQKVTPGHQQQQQKPQTDAKADQAQLKATGDQAQSESHLPVQTRKCFVTTSKGSKLLLFLDPSMDAKHILSEFTEVLGSQRASESREILHTLLT